MSSASRSYRFPIGGVAPAGSIQSHVPVFKPKQGSPKIQLLRKCLKVCVPSQIYLKFKIIKISFGLD
jgi:hypothetical protein